ncbi:MAG: Fic family protein [Planctomycetes bacterium]|nr:Fic family protein [Planctomycetota bacterium]
MRNQTHLFAALDAVRARLDEQRPHTPELTIQIERWFVPRYIYCSSAIGREDFVSARETALFLEAEVVSGGHTLDAFLSIHRHQRALELVGAAAEDGIQFDPAFALTIHRMLLEGSRALREGARPGLFKSEPSSHARRRGHTFEFALPSETGDLMTQLCSELHKRETAAEPEHPLLTLAWLYFHLFLIHPFASHNGRVARLLCTLVARHHGYPGLILAPGSVGELLDSLVAVHRTLPVSQRKPLSPRYDLSALVELFAAALSRTGERLAELVEGRKLDAGSFATRIEADQARQLTRFVGNKLSWRVGATAEVRALHSRCIELAEKLQSEGLLYSVFVERAEVVPSHRANRTVMGQLPGAEAGLIGEVQVAVVPSETMKGLEFPPSQRLVIGVGSTQYGLHLVLASDKENERPKVHTGSLRASEWTADALEAMVVRGVDKRRKSYEYELNVLNASRSQRFKLKRLHQDAEDQVQAPEGPRVRPSQRHMSARETRTTMRLRGLTPAEPPLEF